MFLTKEKTFYTKEEKDGRGTSLKKAESLSVDKTFFPFAERLKDENKSHGKNEWNKRCVSDTMQTTMKGEENIETRKNTENEMLKIIYKLNQKFLREREGEDIKINFGYS